MQCLIKFKNFVDEILKENSRNYKISVLEKYKHDPTIGYFLNYIYNPYITTGISNKKLNKEVEWTYLVENHADAIPKGVIPLLEYIKRNNTGKDNILKLIKAFKFIYLFLQLDPIDNDYENLDKLLDKLICKNLQLGVDVLTINKIMPNLISTFNVQLANKYFDKPEFVEGKNFAITEKIDGGRIIAIKKNNEVKFYTRAGQLYEGLVDLENELLEKFPDNICLDGEITLLNSNGMSSKDCYKQTMKITRKDGIKHGVKMLVFDCMTADEFELQDCLLTYEERRFDLEHYFKEQMTYFELLPILYKGNDTSKISEILNEQVSLGHEGIMINICDAKYEFKRTNNLLKCKLFNTYDLEIIGFEEGTGRLENKLGAILVKYKNGNIVKVGSGFSDPIRKEIWINRDNYLNKIVEISYFEETTNQEGGESLRFPVFKNIRTDKLKGDF